MKYTNRTFRGMLKFDVAYDITDVDTRLVPYTRTGAKYQPDFIRFSLVSTSDGAGRPDITDLKVDTVSLHGKKLKKDGTPGLAEVHEKLWMYECKRWPDWIMPLIGYASKELSS